MNVDSHEPSMNVNVFDLCRLCATTTSQSHDQRRDVKMIHIFSTAGLQQNIADKINCHLPIKVHKHDGFPQLVCHLCLKKLNSCHSLMSNCLKANATIRGLIDKSAQLQWMPNIDDKGIIEHDFVELPSAKAQEEEIKTFQMELLVEPTVQKNRKGASKTCLDTSWDEGNHQQSNVWPSNSKDHDASCSDTDDNTDDQWHKKASPPTDEPEVAVVATIDCMNDKDPESDSKILLVAMDKSSCKTLKQRKEAAKAAAQKAGCNLTSEESSLVRPSQCLFQCRFCGVEFCKNQDLVDHYSLCHIGDELETLSDISNSIKNLTYGTIKDQKISISAIRKCVISYVEKTVSAFLQKPLEICVMQLGHFDSKSEKFALTTCSPENAYHYSSRESKVGFDEAAFKKEDVSVRYLCGICDESFPHNREYFIDHLVMKHFSCVTKNAKMLHSCCICEKQFKNKSSLTKHIIVQHNTDSLEEVVCDVCGKLVVKQRLSTHKYGHRRKECMYCHQMLAPRAWARHKKFQQDPNARNDRKRSCMNVPPRKSVEQKRFDCNFCNRGLLKQTWIYHAAFREVFGDNVACPEETPSPLEKQMSPEELITFNSKLQNAEVAWNLRLKEQREAGETKIECTFCNRLITRAHYQIHLRQHTGDKQFECNYCSKLFAAKNMLHHHITAIHLKIGFNCQYCAKFFSRHKRLMAHEALHRGERNFKCPFCPKYFSGSSNVSGHVKLVHEKRYSYRKRSKRTTVILENPSLLDF